MIHIIGPPAEVTAAYPLLVRELDLMGLRVCPSKSVAWFPRGLLANLQLPHGCQTPANGLAILKVPLGTPAHVAVDLRERLQQHLAPLPSPPWRHSWLPGIPSTFFIFPLRFIFPPGFPSHSHGGLGCRSLEQTAQAAWAAGTRSPLCSPCASLASMTLYATWRKAPSPSKRI
eukprot:SM000141S00880  [mRNA]  locus=s141:186669:187351:- [translate_table: standard]